MSKNKKKAYTTEQKFQLLKSKGQKDQMKIGQVVQIITHGLVKQYDVQLYLQMLSANPEIQQTQKVVTEWYTLSPQSMILLIDKVIKFKNIKKQKKVKKQVLNIEVAVKQVKQKVDAIKNDYTRKGSNVKQKIKVKEEQNVMQQNIQSEADTKKKESEQIKKVKKVQNQSKQKVSKDISSSLKLSSDKQYVDTFFADQTDMIHSQHLVESQQSDIINTVKQIQSIPVNEKELSEYQNPSFLQEKLQNSKTQLEQKLKTVFKFYQKQVHVPYQSFEKNQNLNMDLKLFLKYFKQFNLNKKYKVSQATKSFKKMAQKGLWLNKQGFVKLHCQMAQTSQYQAKQKKGNLSTLNDKKEDNKKQNSKKSKSLIKNINSFDQLSAFFSNQKIKSVISNKNALSPNQSLRRIVNLHTGLNQEDILWRLDKRSQERNLKRKNILNKSLQKKLEKQNSTLLATSSIRGNISPTVKITNKRGQSIYRQLQLPQLRSRQMKASSVYQSLTILKVQKEKEKLKMLIKENQKQSYLEQYFQKEKSKSYSKAYRTNPITLLRYNTQMTSQSTQTSQKKIFSVKLTDKNLTKKLSLPRMKFT